MPKSARSLRPLPCGGQIWPRVIDRVRVDEANRISRDKPTRQGIKQSRWLLLRNPQNLTRRSNRCIWWICWQLQALMTVYLMKAELKTLWTPSTVTGGHRQPCSLIDACGPVGRISKRITIIKRMAYGYRENKFFLMKVQRLLPLIRGEPILFNRT